jgi:hypothetical protein
MINLDLDKLRELIKKHTVTVSFNGFAPYQHDVVNAKKLFEELHEIVDCDKDTFVAYVNEVNKKAKASDGYELIIKTLFGNIKHQGVFKTLGHEALGTDPYIEVKDLNVIMK